MFQTRNEGAQFHAVIALYDPVFYHEGLGKTVAQMSLEEKNKVSHRGIALLEARTILVEEFLG